MSFYVYDNSFRIESLMLKKHDVFKDIKLNFIDGNDFKINPLYFSILIGPNGTGKSEILKVILNLMRSLNLKIQDKKEPSRNYFFRLEFYKDGNKYCYYNYEEKKINLVAFDTEGRRFPESKISLLNKELTEYSKYSILPSSIIAQSIMLTDKFIVPRNNDEIEEFKIYKYLGLRNRPQQASTRYYVRRTIELIVENVHLDRFQDGVLRMMNFLQLSNDVEIKYRTVYTTKFFKGSLTVKELQEYFKEIEIKYEGKQAPYKLYHFKNIEKNKDLIDLVEFVNHLYHDKRLTDIYRSSAKHLSYNIASKADQRFLKLDYEQLDDLRKIGLLSVPDVRIENSKVTLQDMSSGEFHFFSTVVGLLAAVEAKSLVLIDEPEISLHPNWQMKYLSFIRELFSSSAFEGTHFIIATHSHFLISDLEGDSGNIIGLRKENGNISSMEIQRDTFGWSAEEVLYKVFGVKTTRNYYLELELRELLHRIAIKDQNKGRMMEILNKLENIEFSENDPLNVVINRAKKYLND